MRQVILDGYDSYRGEYLRDVFYMIGDLLGSKIGKEITKEDYDWYNTKQGYATLRDDVWTDIEQKHGLKRPKAWSYGIVFDNNVEHSLESLKEKMESGLQYIWDQARGFIFVEKGGVAKKLKVLSKFGWTIFAGKGYPERLLRKLLKEEEKKRPVLVLHDWDQDGQGILRTMESETRRTKHLDIALRERVTDLGLTRDDIKKLKLPTRPSPPKYKGKPRVEISGLAVLKVRMDIENPILAYTVAKMLALGLVLSPFEIAKKDLLGRHLRWTLTEGLSSTVNDVIEEFIEDLELAEDASIEGKAVKGILQTAEIIAEEVTDALMQTAQNLVDNLSWQDQNHWHTKAVKKFTDDRLVQILEKRQ